MKSLIAFGLLGILCVGFMTNTTVEMAKVTNDPGRCDFKSRGKTTIIADNNGNDRLLVCVRNNGEFTWKTLSNSFQSLGEYFDPANDCSQIAQKRSDAKDGFYWIKTTGLQKVWCDVTTDGGGFMLVGHIDTPKWWTLPSDWSVVAPNGKPHWSSVLGNATMVEFRVQISITNIPEQSRADWLYRFKDTRHLKELLMDKQGCTNNHPGIGNIEYVKDLLAGNIVNKKFNCSRFGPSYSSNRGWERMNECLGQACKEGYATIPGRPGDRYDDFGMYSYSTSSQKSGISHSSTALIGCDNGECCACFGPKGATGNFCAPECRSINGGTLTKKAHAWFWIRSSVPNRPFLKKCMEYIVETDKGNMEKHFIDTQTGILKKGSCEKKGVASLVDGVVQVANKADLEKVPLVIGLMSYRKDNEKLYLTNGRSWQALGKEKQIDDLVNSVTKLRKANAELQKKVEVLEEKHHIIMKSCSDLYKNGARIDGVYTINHDGFGGFRVKCDMTTGGGGWTVFQRRMNGTVDFYRGWSDYKEGFGDVNGEFWLGLEKINQLSKSGQNVLRVDLEDFSGGKAYAQYSTFTVLNEGNKYGLTVGGFSGNAGDSLYYHNGMKFSTKDSDNEQDNRNCAIKYKGGWWYRGCYHSNLNGIYKHDSRAPNEDGVIWSNWKGSNYSLKKTEMKIRPRSF